MFSFYYLIGYVLFSSIYIVLLKQLYKRINNTNLSMLLNISNTTKRRTAKLCVFSITSLQLELLLRKLLRILDVSCAHENENAVLCFFNTSVVVSVINSAPSIRFCRSSIVNSPLFSRADPKISHKYT